MKKNLFAIISFCLLLFLGTTNMNAQGLGEWTGGVDAVYGLDIEEVGVQARLGTGIADAISINADFIYWLIGVDGVNFSEINLNGQYHFQPGESFDPYGLAGLGIFLSSIEVFGTKITGSDVGANIGVGSNFGLGDNVGINAEATYNFGGAEQLKVGAGVFFNF